MDPFTTHSQQIFIASTLVTEKKGANLWKLFLIKVIDSQHGFWGRPYSVNMEREHVVNWNKSRGLVSIPFCFIQWTTFWLIFHNPQACIHSCRIYYNYKTIFEHLKPPPTSWLWSWTKGREITLVEYYFSSLFHNFIPPVEPPRRWKENDDSFLID